MSPLGKCGQTTQGCVTKNITKILWKIDISLKLLLTDGAIFSLMCSLGKTLTNVQWKALKGLELRQLDLFCLEKKKPKEYIIPVFSYIRRGVEETEQKLLEMHNENCKVPVTSPTKGNADIRKKCLTVRPTNWPAARKVVDLHPWRYSECVQGHGLNSPI